MNDESSVFENTETASLAPCDSLATEITSTGNGCDGESERENPCGAVENTVDVPADTGTDSDFDSEDSDPQAQASELEQLRSELKQLREELALRDARTQQEERVTRDVAEFCTLYPEVPISTLPTEIWHDVEKGNSLAAAYALADRKSVV